MDSTMGRSDDYLPAKRPYVPRPSLGGDKRVPDFSDLPETSNLSKGVSFRVLLRAIRRYWWQSLILWGIGSAALMALAYRQIEPTYDAAAQIRVENTSFSFLTDRTLSAPIDFNQYMETLVSNIGSPTVVGIALSKHPELSNLPLLRNTTDPEVAVRKALRVSVLRGTSLIDVQMSSKSPGEAAALVNAVVDTFVELAGQQYDTATRSQIERLKVTKNAQESEVTRYRKQMEGLVKEIGGADVDLLKDRNSASIDTYRRLSEELTNVEIQQISVEARLHRLKSEKVSPTVFRDPKEIEDAVVESFYSHPLVAPLSADMAKLEKRLVEAERLVRDPNDPSRARLASEKKELQARIDALWVKLNARIRTDISSTPKDDIYTRAISETDADLEAIKTQREALIDRLSNIQRINKSAESDGLRLEFLRNDLKRAEDTLDKIQAALNQLEHDAKNPVARITREYSAKPSNLPDTDRRFYAMLVSPLFVGFLILNGLVLLERHGSRVSDPEELSSRMNLRVIGVVPPLPQIRPAALPADGVEPSPADLKARRQLDEFVQSLDHLRVALCARRDPWGRDRHCVLITSPCSSEGKTTLAAQLAERCVNAGLMTLLIDADLRNPTLSRMLEAHDNPGLINVLRGEVSAEDVIMVIGDAGGFHLLPAGNPRMDPSRLLTSDRLGKLLAQARESFDMIIVDSPPVLPVPDALTIGRRTDGAVLAVRHDRSRLPQIDRAFRQLTHVGVPVIGAVVNGVRSSERYGGYYSYGYGTTYGEPMDDRGQDSSPVSTARDD